MLLSLILLPCCLHLSLMTVSSAAKLKTLYKWKYIDYTWESYADRTAAIKSGYYNREKSIIIDVDVWKSRKVFVTVLRRDGVPASLTTVSNRTGGGGPLLQPYPNWSLAWNVGCKRITNAYRITIDECDRLWVLDNGLIDGKQICPVQLLAFDLKTDRLVTRVAIPSDDYRSPMPGLLVTPVVDTAGPYCQRTHVYIADVTGHLLLVWNGTHITRLPSPAFAFHQSPSNVKIVGESFELANGVLGVALSPRRIGQPRSLAFRPFGSFDINFITTSHLQYFDPGKRLEYKSAFRVLPSQTVAMAFSSQGILFFGLTSETPLACWNVNKPNIRENIVMLEENRQIRQFPSGLKITLSHIPGFSDQIWMVTNSFQKIAKGIQNLNAVNFRIITGPVDYLIAGTNCQPGPMDYSLYL